MSVITVNQSTVGEEFTDTLTADGAPADLTTATSVHFVLTDFDENIIIDQVGMVTDAPTGHVEYVSVSGDLDTSGNLRQRWVVYYAGPITETYPSLGWNTVVVETPTVAPFAALATLEDLAARLDGGIPAGKETRAAALLIDASAAVRNYTGQEFTAGTSTDALLRPKNGVVRLPQRPVTNVYAVTDINDGDILYTWEGDDRISAAANVPDSFSFEPWRQRIRNIKVTYDHGFAIIPDDIVAVVCQIAGRALGVSPQDSGHSQESIAGYSYSIGTAAASGPFGMLPDEKAILDKYTFPQIGSIAIGF